MQLQERNLSQRTTKGNKKEARPPNTSGTDSARPTTTKTLTASQTPTANTATDAISAKALTRATSTHGPRAPPGGPRPHQEGITASKTTGGEHSLPLPTPVKATLLRKMLSNNFPKKEYLVRGFTEGFSLNFEGQRVGLLAENSATVRRNVNVALDKINKEINLGRIAGPFNSIPFSNLKCIPLALRAKSTPGEFRLLHNLSYPYNELSVNLCIPDEQKSVKYA